jgi:hypothetical protein
MDWSLGRLAALAAACAAVAVLLAGASRAADVGANDDTATYEADGGAHFYSEMAALGLHESLLTVRFRPSDPTQIPNRDALDLAVENARAAGLRVILAVYPYPPRELAFGVGSPSAFATWLTMLATRYPQVRQYVVGNEPNQAAFLRPQFGRTGRNVSAARAGAYLAAGYDALKAVDAAITIVGVGLSPRGNDDPHAPTNASVSPLRFIAALGRWYRASGRTAPLMDGFSFHPYPRKATDPLEQGYNWPNAGFVNLDRVKQGLWDAFHGTPQPTTVDGLELYLDEVGWQVGTTGRDGYTGRENVAVTSEAGQAAIYGTLVGEAACDPAVAEVNFFGFHDDGLRTGFQAGLYRADGTPRPSADAVRLAIADSALGCRGLPVVWAPATGVKGAQAGGMPLVGLYGPMLAATPLSISVSAVAAEGATARASLLRLASPDLPGLRIPLAAHASVATAAVSVLHPPGTAKLRIDLPGGLPAGRYVVLVRFTAEQDPRRTTLVRGTPFIVW